MSEQHRNANQRGQSTGAEPDEPLVDDLVDETRRPGHNPEAGDREQPDPPTTPETPEPPD